MPKQLAFGLFIGAIAIVDWFFVTPDKLVA
jgi:hypothetical protein